MKKTIFVLATIFSFAVLFTSCKETKKEEVHMENHEDHKHSSEEMASKDVYQCPMDCEKGKTYDVAGSCPVCKMDLKMKSEGMDMKHADGCKCKESGECKCESGKCQCKAEVASSADMCKCKDGVECKCESGKCECKV